MKCVSVSVRCTIELIFICHWEGGEGSERKWHFKCNVILNQYSFETLPKKFLPKIATHSYRNIFKREKVRIYKHKQNIDSILRTYFIFCIEYITGFLRGMQR